MSSLINQATIQIRKDTAGNWTSNNPTPAAGEWCREIDTGAIKQGDGSTAWNDLEYRQQLPFTNDLTGANITHTLPAITGFPQTEAIYWKNGGTYKLTLAVSDSETVGGISAGTWEGEGEGHMLLESDGSNWQVREYKDSGSNAQGSFWKQKDGTQRCVREGVVNIATTTGYVGGFRSGSTSKDFSLQFLTASIPHILVSTTHGNTFGTLSLDTDNALTKIMFLTVSSEAAQDHTFIIEAIGRWRT